MIQKNIGAFYEVGRALMEIRDKGLYKDVLELHDRDGWSALGYKSWTECVQREFKQAERYIFYQFKAGQIEQNLNDSAKSNCTIVQLGSIPEGQLRPLARLEPSQQREAWQKAVDTAYEVGRALMEIRDKGLYKDVLGFDTFEAYCKGRWDFSRRHAYRFIEAVEVIGHVSESDTKPPINLEQTRPLSKLEPELTMIDFIFIAVIAGAVAGIGLALLFNRLCEFAKRQPEK